MTIPPTETFMEKLEDTLGIPHGASQPASTPVETSPVPAKDAAPADTPAPQPTVTELEGQIDALTHRVLLLETAVQKLVYINRKDMPSE